MKLRKIPQGCSKNDMLLIAYAKQYQLTVVTEERVQKESPTRRKKNYNIPSVCREEKVSCANFVGLLNQLGIII